MLLPTALKADLESGLQIDAKSQLAGGGTSRWPTSGGCRITHCKQQSNAGSMPAVSVPCLRHCRHARSAISSCTAGCNPAGHQLDSQKQNCKRKMLIHTTGCAGSPLNDQRRVDSALDSSPLLMHHVKNVNAGQRIKFESFIAVAGWGICVGFRRSSPGTSCVWLMPPPPWRCRWPSGWTRRPRPWTACRQSARGHRQGLSGVLKDGSLCYPSGHGSATCRAHRP